MTKDGFYKVKATWLTQLGLKDSMLLALLYSRYNYWKEKDLLVCDKFYYSASSMERDTGMLYKSQHTALRSLEEQGYIEVGHSIGSNKRYIKLNHDAIEKMEISEIKKLKEYNKKIEADVY